jgi:hypothetical protein
MNSSSMIEWVGSCLSTAVKDFLVVVVEDISDCMTSVTVVVQCGRRR